MWNINVFIMQIEYVKISCKEDVHIYCANFTKNVERNSHETTSWWKIYGIFLFFKDFEVQDDIIFPLLKFSRFLPQVW